MRIKIVKIPQKKISIKYKSMFKRYMKKNNNNDSNYIYKLIIIQVSILLIISSNTN